MIFTTNEVRRELRRLGSKPSARDVKALEELVWLLRDDDDAAMNRETFVKEGGVPLVLMRWRQDQLAQQIIETICRHQDSCFHALQTAGFVEEICRLCQQDPIQHQRMALYCFGQLMSKCRSKITRWWSTSIDKYPLVLAVLPSLLQEIDTPKQEFCAPLIDWLETFLFDWPRSHQPQQAILDALRVVSLLVQVPLNCVEQVQTKLVDAITHCGRFAQDQPVKDSCKLMELRLVLQEQFPSMADVFFEVHSHHLTANKPVHPEVCNELESNAQFAILQKKISGFVDAPDSSALVLKFFKVHYVFFEQRWATHADARRLIAWICDKTKLCSAVLPMGLVDDVLRFIEEDSERAVALQCLRSILDCCATSLSTMVVKSCQATLKFYGCTQSENPTRKVDHTQQKRYQERICCSSSRRNNNEHAPPADNGLVATTRSSLSSPSGATSVVLMTRRLAGGDVEIKRQTIARLRALCNGNRAVGLELVTKRDVLNTLIAFWEATDCADDHVLIAEFVHLLASDGAIALEMTRRNSFLFWLIGVTASTSTRHVWSCLRALAEHEHPSIQDALLYSGVSKALLVNQASFNDNDSWCQRCGVLENLCRNNKNEVCVSLAHQGGVFFALQALETCDRTVQVAALHLLRALTRAKQVVKDFSCVLISGLESLGDSPDEEVSYLAHGALQQALLTSGTFTKWSSISSVESSSPVPTAVFLALDDSQSTRSSSTLSGEMESPVDERAVSFSSSPCTNQLADAAPSVASQVDSKASQSPSQSSFYWSKTGAGCNQPQEDQSSGQDPHQRRLVNINGHTYELGNSFNLDGRHDLVEGTKQGLFGKRVMIKIYKDDLRSRGLNEVAKLSTLSRFHEAATFCVNCEDFSETVVFKGRSRYAFVMELGKKNLKQMIEGYRCRPTSRNVLPTIAKIAECLLFLHSTAKMVHCDVKLENVVNFADGDGYPEFKLIDFENCCKIHEPIPKDCSAEYCPPELAVQVVRKADIPLGASTSFDIWCFGVLWIKYLVRGQLLVEFQDLEPPAILQKIAAPDFNFEQTLSQLNVSDAMKSLIRACTAREPTRRPTCLEILQSSVLRDHCRTLLQQNLVVETDAFC